jgi:hypothetical protein
MDAVDGKAYFAAAVSYERKIFIILTPQTIKIVNIPNILLLTGQGKSFVLLQVY